MFSVLFKLSEFLWLYALLSVIFAFFLLIRPTVNAVKWILPPRLNVQFAYPAKPSECVVEFLDKEGERDKIVAHAEKELRVGISIRADWEYTPRLIDIRGDEKTTIERNQIFVEGTRPWEKPYPGPDIHGDFKVMTVGYVLKSETTETPMLIDIHISPPLEKGEERKVKVEITTEESRKSFIKDLWIEGR